MCWTCLAKTEITRVLKLIPCPFILVLTDAPLVTPERQLRRKQGNIEELEKSLAALGDRLKTARAKLAEDRMAYVLNLYEQMRKEVGPFYIRDLLQCPDGFLPALLSRWQDMQVGVSSLCCK